MTKDRGSTASVGVFIGLGVGSVFHAHHWPIWIGLPLTVVTAVIFATALSNLINWWIRR